MELAQTTANRRTGSSTRGFVELRLGSKIETQWELIWRCANDLIQGFSSTRFPPLTPYTACVSIYACIHAECERKRRRKGEREKRRHPEPTWIATFYGHRQPYWKATTTLRDILDPVEAKIPDKKLIGAFGNGLNWREQILLGNFRPRCQISVPADGTLRRRFSFLSLSFFFFFLYLVHVYTCIYQRFRERRRSGPHRRLVWIHFSAKSILDRTSVCTWGDHIAGYLSRVQFRDCVKATPDFIVLSVRLFSQIAVESAIAFIFIIECSARSSVWISNCQAIPLSSVFINFIVSG